MCCLRGAWRHTDIHRSSTRSRYRRNVRCCSPHDDSTGYVLPAACMSICGTGPRPPLAASCVPSTGRVASYGHTQEQRVITMQAAMSCLHGIIRICAGVACAAAPPRRRSRVRPACRRARIHAREQLCAVSMMCCVHTREQHVLLLLYDDAAWTGSLVSVCAYTHTSSCVLSP